MVRLHRGRYYFDFLKVVEVMKTDDNSCFICGSTKKVNPHHILKVKDSDRRYADPNNVVLLCGHHHQLYHQKYGSGKGVNPKTFMIFCKKEFEKKVRRLEQKIFDLSFKELPKTPPIRNCKCYLNPIEEGNEK